MLCTNCQENQSIVQLKVHINGTQKHLMLCQDCYQKAREELGASLGPSMSGFSGFTNNDFSDLFKAFSGQPGNTHTGNNSKQPSSAPGGNGIIDQYGRNLTQVAKAGLIDPVIGRDEEVNRRMLSSD